MTIVAVRHLRTSWNQQGLLQGRTDIPLDSEDPSNHQLVAQLKDDLSSYHFDRVVVSPLMRAVQTAERLDFKDHQVDELVKEMSFGAWEGKPKGEMIEAFDGRWESDPMSTELATELKEMYDRVCGFVAGLGPNETVLLISHGAYIRAMKSHFETGSIDAMNRTFLDNGELYIYRQ